MNPNFREFLKANWFRLSVLVLLALCYGRLGEIRESTAYTADVVNDGATRIVNSQSNQEDYLQDIKTNTENTWQILDDRPY